MKFIRFDQILMPFLYIEKNISILGIYNPSGNRVGRDHSSAAFRKVIDNLKIGRDRSMYSWKHTMNQGSAMSGIPLKELRFQNRIHSLDRMDEYMKGLTVWDAKHLFTNIPKM